MPGVPGAGVIFVVSELTLSVVTNGGEKTFNAIPADWSPVQVTVAPIVTQGQGPAVVTSGQLSDRVPTIAACRSAAYHPVRDWGRGLPGLATTCPRAGCNSSSLT